MWITPQVLSAVLATGAELPEVPNLIELAKLDFAATPAVLQQDDDPAEPMIPSTDVKPFGTKNTWRWHAHGGFAADFDDTHNQLFLVGAGVSYFMIRDLSLVLEGNMLHVTQNGPDAFAVNLNLHTRWHVVSEDTWSLYLEAGIGILMATEDVPGPTDTHPLGGSNFNFTPQGGGGVSFEVAPDIRMLVGVRIHHISNARTNETNPGRDSFLIYAGLSMPF